MGDSARGTRLSRRGFARLLALGTPATLYGGTAVALPRAPELPPTPASPSEGFWAAVRGQFAIPPSMAPLNAANLCPAPIPVLEAVYGKDDLDHDISPVNRARLQEAREATRRLLAEDLRVSVDEILLTRNTSESNNLVSSGLDLKAGDEVVVFSDNHPSNEAAWREKARRWGYTVRTVEPRSPHPGPEYYLEAFAAAMNGRTRVLAITHLTNSVGDLLPVKDLCRMARERGVLTLVDGAQSLGLMDVDLGALQPDFYSGSAHKWPCGPKETGLLYVRRDVQARLWPTVYSLYGGSTGISRTFEALGQRDETALAGFGAALRFRARIGRKPIEERARHLAAELAEGLRRLDGVTVYTHADPARSHAVVTFRPAGLDPARLAAALYEKDGIVAGVRAGADRPGLRFSPHLYNTQAEVERALAAVRRYLQAGV